MADQVAAAIYNDRLFAETQAALEDLRAAQRRYQVQAWSEYERTAETLAYETAHEDADPLGDAVLPEIRLSLAQQAPVALDGATTGNGHAALVAPIAFRGEVIGALGIHDEDGGRRWTAQEVALVEAVVGRMGQAAENLRLLEETQRRAAHEQAVSQVAARVRESLDVKTVLTTAAQEMRQALGLSRLAIRLTTEEPADGGAGRDV
jgi:GAF domain-containing protein